MARKITIQYKPQIVNIEDYDESKEINLPSSYDTEVLIMSLSSGEVQVLLLRYLGYNYKEITRIMNLKTIGEFYSILGKLREDVEKFNVKS